MLRFMIAMLGLTLGSSFQRNIRFRSVPTTIRLLSAGTQAEPPQVKVLVPVANGSEEIETTTIVDTLVRGGAKVTVASVSESLQVTCSRGIKLVADCFIADCASEDWDMIACPGGMPGAENLRDSAVLSNLLAQQFKQGKLVSAVCAAPAVVLASQGFLDGKKATCYPAPKFTDTIALHTTDDVVVDGNIITSKGPGTSLSFALKLVEILFGSEKSRNIASEMLHK